MSDRLRAPWLAKSVRMSLVRWQTKEPVQTPREYSISPDGDLLLQGTTKGLLQLTRFLTYGDPLTAKLSDKYNHISCEFTPTCRSRFEAEHEKDLLKIKGALIHLREYEIRFVGSDGALFEKGITFEGHLAIKGARASGPRKSFAGSSRHRPPQTPIPVFVVQKFQLLACEGESIWGTPTAITADTELDTLLARLPRRNVSIVSGNRGRDKELRQSAQRVSGAVKGGREVTRDRGDGDDDDEDEDSQPFATQAPNRFSSTFVDFDFETQSQFWAGAPTGSRLSGDSLPSSLRVPQKNSRPLKRKEVSFEVRLARSAIQPKVQPAAKLRKSHNSDSFSHNSVSDSLVLHPGWRGMMEVTKEDSTVPEDQEMELEKETSWYPPQSKVESPHTSTYNMPKNRSISEKHRPHSIFSRKPTARKTCVTQQKSSPDPAESDDVGSGVSWPSSPEYQDPRFIGRDVTGTPPHSSTVSPVRGLGPSTIQAPKGRSDGSVIKIQVGSGDSPTLPKNGGSRQPASDKSSNKRGKASGGSLALSKDGSPSFSHGPSKRVTRGANGISKRVLPDPTNSVFKRPRRRSNPKKLSYDSADDFGDPEEVDLSDRSSGSRAREFSVEPPFPVIDPYGRTRVAKYGILGAQQVELWDRNRRLAKQSDANSDPADEDNNLSDTSFPDPDILEDLGTFGPGSENGAEDGFSQFVNNHSHEEGLRSISCGVPPSLGSDPVQSLLLSDRDGSSVGGKPTSRSPKRNAESFKALLEPEHNRELSMSGDESGVLQQQPPLLSRTSFTMALSATKREGGQEEAVLNRELSVSPTKSSCGDQKLDKEKSLIRLEEGAPLNGSGLVVGKQVSLDPEPCTLQSRPGLKGVHHLSSPVPAGIVQVKVTPYRGDGQPFLARERAACMNDDSDQEGIPGTEGPPSTVQVPDSSQDQLLRENQEYRGNLKVQVPASSDEVRMQKRDIPVTLPKPVERVLSSSGEIRGSKEADIPETLEGHRGALTGSPIGKQSIKCTAPPFSPVAKKDKVPNTALSTSVPRALSEELENLESSTSVRTKAVSIIDISSDEEVPAPTPPKPVNLREYLRANRAIRDEVAVNKERLELEMYAGIRSRSLHIPGQEGKTEAEKQSEDERRKKYFGTDQARPWNDPWKPVGGLARLEKDRLEKEAELGEDSPSKPSEKPKGTPAVEDWFRDPDTPVKVFLRKLKELKQVKDDALGVGAEDTRADE
ncbi:hypothetical protein HOY80DRAFT_1028551 [Tuber brumale]|nr:hypothetical protein HOY80DRAFT_1028551 [Tuber brumale]